MQNARTIQAKLNTVANAGLVVDGIAGPKTYTALMRVAAGGMAPLALQLAPFLATRLPAFAIDTPRRVFHFLAQGCKETDHFKTLKEYGGPTYFKRYDGRADLGNNQPGDGARFPGRGLLQTTGRANYTALAAATGLDCVNHPELLEDPEHAVEAAVRFWDFKGLNAIADSDNLQRVTRRVNGGLNGLAERQAAYDRLKVLA